MEALKAALNEARDYMLYGDDCGKVVELVNLLVEIEAAAYRSALARVLKERDAALSQLALLQP